MKKTIYGGLLGVAVVLLIAGCKKNNFAVDQDPLAVPPAAKFNTTGNADTTGTYYIRSTGETFKIPIGVTDVSDKDRTIQLCYTSSTGAAAGVQYNAPATFVIPAGKAVDTLNISGLFAGYPLSSRIDTLRIKICGGDVPASAYKNQYRLVMRKYCDVSLAALAGNYTNVIDNGNYGPYAMTATAGTTTGTTGTMTVTNLWDPGVPVTTTVNLNWTNPAGFTATIADQVYYAAANWWIIGTSAGTFSSCDQSFTLRYRLYNKTTGAILYNNQVTVMKR
jgi:hypothetical protein